MQLNRLFAGRGPSVENNENSSNDILQVVSRPTVFAQIGCGVLVVIATALKETVFAGDENRSSFSLIAELLCLTIIAASGLLGLKILNDARPNFALVHIYVKLCVGSIPIIAWMLVMDFWSRQDHSSFILENVLQAPYLIAGLINITAFIRGMSILGRLRRSASSRQSSVFPATVSAEYSAYPNQSNLQATSPGTHAGMTMTGYTSAPLNTQFAPQTGYTYETLAGSTYTSPASYSQGPTQKWM